MVSVLGGRKFEASAEGRRISVATLMRSSEASRIVNELRA
jgi:hypothetical protein